MNQKIVQYCQSCGKPLDAQARFCGRCGKPVPQTSSAPAQTPPAPRPQPQPAIVTPPAEFIVCVLPMCRQRGGFLGMKADSYILVLTNARILVAKQTSELMKENVRVAKEAARQNGKGFFGQWGAIMGSSGSQRYLPMQPAQILSETPGNYSILNDQVRAVKIKETYDSENVYSEVKLIFEMASGKTEFIYTQISKKEIKQALQQTLGNRVR